MGRRLPPLAASKALNHIGSLRSASPRTGTARAAGTPFARRAAVPVFVLLITACGGSVPGDAGLEAAQPPLGADGRILWVDSDGAEHEWAEAVEEALESVLEDTGVELSHLRLDTDGLASEAEIGAVVAAALTKIEDTDPDVIIAVDDDVQTYLVAPHLAGSSIPVVFAGVSRTVAEGTHPASNVTGMVRTELVDQLMGLLQPHAEGDRVGYLSSDTEGERNLAAMYDERFFGGELHTSFVATFEEFQAAFEAIQEHVDVLYVGNNVGITGWDDASATAYILEHTRLPTGSHNTWMAPFVMVTLASPGREQGEWAAHTALAILDDTPVSSIAVEESASGRLIVNTAIAGHLLVEFPPAVLRNAELHRKWTQ